MSAHTYDEYMDEFAKAAGPYMRARWDALGEYLQALEEASPLSHFLPPASPSRKWAHHQSWNGLHVLPEPEDMPYTGPDLFDVAPPGVHALLAYRNVHRFTGVLDGTPIAVQE